MYARGAAPLFGVAPAFDALYSFLFLFFAANDYFCTAKSVSPDGGMVDTKDLKSFGQKWLCGFESRSGHTNSFGGK